MTSLVLRLLLAASLLLFVGCQGADPASTTLGSPSAQATEATPTEEPATDEPSAAPTDDGALPSVDLPSFNADKELEERLPDEIGGATLTKFSFAGEDMLSGGDNPEFEAMLEELGASSSDFSVAIAAGQVGTDTVSIGALRVGGIQGDQALDAFIAAGQAGGEDVDIGEATVGGRSVVTLLDNESSQLGLTYLYASGDVIFFVQSPNEALAAEVIGSLD